MKNLIRISAFFLATLIFTMAVGCKTDYHDTYIYFELTEKPSAVDPQTASSQSELMIVRNIFEGLLRKNESGAIVNGVADTYEQNGLIYTFKLREDALWSNGDKVTANDFVFAFRRAVNPKTESPFVMRLFSIENAESIYSGQMPVDSLGVTAVDEHTLVITLNRDDSEFTDTLTTSICMPCNESFFNSSIGKYGLKSEYTISNGTYSLTKWNKDEFGIRLYRNEKYSGTFNAENGGVFLSCIADREPVELLKENSVDAAFIDCGDISKAQKAQLNTKGFQNTCWILTISPEYKQAIRSSFAMLIEQNVYEKSLEDGFSPADSLFPQIFNISDSVSGVGISQYDLETAKSDFSKAITSFPDKKFPLTTLYYYDYGNIKNVVTDIVGHWQQNLGAYINIQAANSLPDLQSQLINQTYQMAVFPVTAGNYSLKEYLKNYGIDYNGENPADIQSALLGDKTIIPILFQDTTVAYTESLSNFYPEAENGIIDFSFIIKSE